MSKDSPTPRKPCCSVGARPDAAEIDAALARLGQPGAESLSALAARLGLPKSSLSVHRSQHLGGASSLSRSYAPASSSPPASPPERVHERSPEHSEQRSEQAFVSTPSVARARATQAARQLPYEQDALTAEEQQRVTADRIRTVANLLAIGAWKARTHIAGLAQRWGVPETEVRRLHALAALRVKSDRGTLAAQRELSVARVTKLLEEELAAAAMYEKAAEEAFAQAASAPPGKMSTAPARLAKTLASMSRTTALQAEKYLAGITFQRPKDPTAVINVNYSSNPDFAAAAERMRVILETIAPPGTAARVDEAFALWEQGGDAALEEWRREQLEAVSLLLTEQADGSYGDGEAVA